MAKVDEYTVRYGEDFGKQLAEHDDIRDKQIADLHKQYGLQEDGTYQGGLVGQTEQAYNDLIQQSHTNEAEQKRLQEEGHKLATDLLEQEKEKADKGFEKETANAYADYERAIDPYGVEAEKIAARGLLHSGYSESYQSRAYVAYQNRVAIARTSLEEAKRDYNNKMAEAILKNSSALAEITAKSFAERTQFIIDSITTKDKLLTSLFEKKTAIENVHRSRWEDTLDQINAEREYKLKQKDQELNERQVKIAEEKWAQEKAEYANNDINGGGGSSGGSGGSTGKTNYGNSTKVESARIRRQGTGLTVDSDSYLKVVSQLRNIGIYAGTPEQLNKYVGDGLVTETQKNGKLYYSLSKKYFDTARKQTVLKFLGLNKK